MGRIFATVYRVVLVGLSLSALVLSIMSASSCAFVEFNHQYKDDLRLLLSLDSSSSSYAVVGDRGRKLPPSTAMPDDDSTMPNDDSIMPDDDNDDQSSTTSTAFDGADTTTHANGTATTTHPNGTATTTHPNGTTTTTHAGAAPSPTSSAEASTSSVSSTGGGTVAGASAIGDAGLFCDGYKALSVTSLWGGTFLDVEDKIDDASDGNQSEELARNAAIAAALFGSLILSILAVGSIIGWRCICEGYIVCLVSLVACVSQGVTFLFFNSERYCDGDIVAEIINQKPCVLGEGGKYSVAALILYAVVMIMACRIPQDDPFGLCRRNDREPVRSRDPVGDGASPGGGKSGLFGGGKNDRGDAEDENTARSGREHDRPNWLSEEKANEDEENELI